MAGDEHTPIPSIWAPNDECKARHERSNKATAAVAADVVKLETTMIKHDRRLGFLFGVEGEQGKVGQMEKRLDNSRNFTIAVFVVAVGLLASVLGAWTSITGKLSAVEAQQEIILEHNRGE